MKEYHSEHTGNVTYISDDGRFSSMSKRYVRLWEETQQGKNLEPSGYIFWMCAGHLKEERGATGHGTRAETKNSTEGAERKHE